MPALINRLNMLVIS